MTKQIKLMTVMASAIMFFAACSSDKLEAYQGQPDTNLESPSNAISFGTYMGKTGTTRAGATGEIVSPSAGSGNKLGTTNYEFGVIAFNHLVAWETAKSSATPNFMYNQKVSSSDNGATWTYSPVKYWPNGEDGNVNGPSNSATQDNTYGKYLSFFAYAPFIAKTSAISDAVGILKINDSAAAIGSEEVSKGNRKTGEPTVDYALTSTSGGFMVGSNVDLLWGTRNKSQYDQADGTDLVHALGTTYNTDLTKQNTTEKVSFLFKHALSKVGGNTGLKIVADFDGNGVGESGFGSKDATTLITVKSITIGNVANAVTTTGTFNLATGLWTATNNNSIAASTPINLTFDESDIALNTDILEKATASNNNCPVWDTDKWYTNNGSGAKSATEIKGVTTEAKNVSASDGSAFYLIPGQSDQQLTVTVDYVVRTYDANLAVPTNEVSSCSKVEQVITNTVTLPSSLLAPNKSYALVIHLGMTSVKFTAQVQDWESVGDSEVEEVWLPSNVVANSTSVSLASGSGAIVYVPKTANASYAINLTGLTNNAALTVVSSDNTNAGVTASQTATGTSHTVNVDVTENTTAARSFTITITDTSAEPDKVTTVIINQAAGS